MKIIGAALRYQQAYVLKPIREWYALKVTSTHRQSHSKLAIHGATLEEMRRRKRMVLLKRCEIEMDRQYLPPFDRIKTFDHLDLCAKHHYDWVFKVS